MVESIYSQRGALLVTSYLQNHRTTVYWVSFAILLVLAIPVAIPIAFATEMWIPVFIAQIGVTIAWGSYFPRFRRAKSDKT